MLKIPMPVKPKTQSFEGSLEFKWLWLDHNFKTMIDIGSNNGEFIFYMAISVLSM